MITRIIVPTVTWLFLASIAFSQMKYGRPSSKSPTPTPTPTPTPMTQQKMASRSGQIQPMQSTAPMQRTMQAANQPKATPIPAQIQPRLVPTPPPVPMKPTPTPVPPPDVKAYLDRQVANSKDKKFHMTVNGKDLALTPFHVWAQKSTGAGSTSTCIDMKSDDGRIYDIDFVTTGPQVTGIRIHKVNGEPLR
jgi:hypothetical protein